MHPLFVCWDPCGSLLPCIGSCLHGWRKPMRTAAIALMLSTSLLSPACSEAEDALPSNRFVESSVQERVSPKSGNSDSCVVSDVTRGPVWTEGRMSAISFAGIKLGTPILSVPSIVRSHGLSVKPYGDGSSDMGDFDLLGSPGVSAIGYVPWQRSYEVNGDWDRKVDDLADLVLAKNGPVSDGKGVPSATVFRAPSEGKMVSAAIHADFPIDDPDLVIKSMTDRYGLPTVMFRTSGSCGESLTALYDSVALDPNPWSFDHYRNCVAAGGFGGLQEFSCEVKNAHKSRWLGISIRSGNASIHLEDGSIGYVNRYSADYNKTVSVVEN
jgi:hypothetical protein